MAAAISRMLSVSSSSAVASARVERVRTCQTYAYERILRRETTESVGICQQSDEMLDARLARGHHDPGRSLGPYLR